MDRHIRQVLSPAKINLFLYVTGRRPDGYHDLYSLMCCVDLYDTIHLHCRAPETTVTCSHPDVPEDSTNLAYQAAEKFFKAANIHEGVAIDIDKKIPVAGGLGGGSSNAAAVLMGLNQHYGRPLTSNQLSRIALTIGADVPFFLFAKPALASGVGDQLKPFAGLPSKPVLLINPGYKVPTGHVYKNLNLRLTKDQKKLNRFEFKKEEFNIVSALGNDLESVTLKMHPGLTEIKKQLMRVGAEGALMSGSGPTLFGLFADSDTAHAAYEKMVDLFDRQVFLCNLLTA
jgi:4-diphosphocytidyl-2-C-methyl-D-erythritol kinase